MAEALLAPDELERTRRLTKTNPLIFDELLAIDELIGGACMTQVTGQVVEIPASDFGIDGVEEWKPNLADMFRLNALWDSFPNCGFAWNHQFNDRLNGVEYVTKCLSELALRDGLAGDFYEGSKFALRCVEVTLSNALA